MTKKDLRKFLKRYFDIFSFALFVFLLIRHFCGVNDKLELIYMVIYLINIFFEVIYRTKYYGELRKYEKRFKMLEDMHKIRYEEYYLLGRKQDVEFMSKVFDKCAMMVISDGKELIKDERAGRSERKQIQNIINKTQELIKTIEPPTA